MSNPIEWGPWMSLRETALTDAIAFGPATSELALLDRAERFYRFLQGVQPVRLVLSIGPTRKQNTNAPPGGPTKEADMAQMHDDDEFDISVAAKDGKGFDVPDMFTASVDNTDVATVTAADDGRTFTVVAGNPGHAVVLVSDGTVSATMAVDVVPGDVALIELVAGEMRKQA